jgi:hypothetical protein
MDEISVLLLPTWRGYCLVLLDYERKSSLQYLSIWRNLFLYFSPRSSFNSTTPPTTQRKNDAVCGAIYIKIYFLPYSPPSPMKGFQVKNCKSWQLPAVCACFQIAQNKQIGFSLQEMM